jgi:hypothetical protein
VPLFEMIIESDTNQFLHISDCQERHFPFYDSRHRSLDFFQINLKERILIWSLDENALVMDLKNYQKLISPERFVDCGFTLFKTVTKRNNKGQNSTKIQELL